MKRFHLSLLLVLSAAMVACGGNPASAPRPGATATFEAARAQLLATRQAQRAQTEDARPSPTPTITRATATPQPTAASLSTPVPVTLGADVSSLMSWMPTLAQVPPGFIVNEDSPLTVEDLAAANGSDPAAYGAQLSAWGFQRAAIRTFEWLDLGYGDDVPALEEVSTIVMEFDSPGNALAALEWERTRVGQVFATVSDAEIGLLGDAAFAVSAQRQAESGGAEHSAFVWVQTGNFAIHFSGRSTSGDVFTDVADIARTTITEQPNTLGAPFPTLGDMPDGFMVYYEGLQTIEEIAEMYETDYQGQIDRLNSLGFTRSAFKVYGTDGFADFAGPEASADSYKMAANTQQGIAVIYAEVYEFGSAEQALEAVEYDRDGWGVKSWDNPLDEVEIPAIGATSYAFRGDIGMDGTVADVFVILVQNGVRQYVFTGLSYFAGNVPDLVSLAQSTVARAAQ